MPPASGNSVAVDWADSLIDNGYWEVPDNSTPVLGDTVTLRWSTDGGLAANDGTTMLLNKKLGNNQNESNFSPYFLRGMTKDNKKLDAQVVLYQNDNLWKSRQETSLDYDKEYWYWVIDAPIDGTEVPGPLPLLGAGAAFGWSRRLRQRVRQASAG